MVSRHCGNCINRPDLCLVTFKTDLIRCLHLVIVSFVALKAGSGKLAIYIDINQLLNLENASRRSDAFQVSDFSVIQCYFTHIEPSH